MVCPSKLLTPKPIKPCYFAFLGRIAPEKGIDRAIRIAAALRRAAQGRRKSRQGGPGIFRREDRADDEVGNVEFIGEINEKEKSEFLSGAIVLLVPIDWPEPFGLVMIEAMACGTPVIAFNRGSVPEVIDDGVTGFIVEE